MTKTFWKCGVCGDIHYGNTGPEICPTCGAENAYTAVSREDAKKAMKL